MPSLNLNASFLATSAFQNLTHSQSSLDSAATRLSSGLRINSNQDAAAGLQIASRLAAQSNGLNAAVRNINVGVSLLQVGSGALSEMSTTLERMSQLANHANSNETTQQERSKMQQEYDVLSTQLSNIVTQTSFNGRALLSEDGSNNLANGGITFQSGASSDDSTTLDISAELGTLHAALQAAGGSNAGQELNQGNTSTAVDLLSAVSASISAVQSAIGGASNRLQYALSDQATSSLANLSTAGSRITDSNTAFETAYMTKDDILNQVGTGVIAQSNSLSVLARALLR